MRQTAADLGACRFLLRTRPAHLPAEEQARLDALLASPVGTPLRTARDFLADWYAIWRDADGQRRSLADAQVRWQEWREHGAYQAVAPLRRVQQNVDETRFARLSQFLRQPTWEATNNGAERLGRTFRQEGPHFTLRTMAGVEGALKAQAFLRLEQQGGGGASRVSPCGHGRKRRPPAVRPLAA